MTMYSSNRDTLSDQVLQYVKYLTDIRNVVSNIFLKTGNVSLLDIQNSLSSKIAKTIMGCK